MKNVLGYGEGMVSRRILVPSAQVVFVKGIIDAHEGLAQVFADSGGDLMVAAPANRARELDELVDDLVRESLAISVSGD